MNDKLSVLIGELFMSQKKEDAVESTLAAHKLDEVNEALNSAENHEIQGAFNDAFKGMEMASGNDQPENGPLTSVSEDDEDKATVVLDMTQLQSQLDSSSLESTPEIDLNFGSSDEGGLSLNTPDSQLEEMPVAQEESLEGGLDLSLDSQSLELTGSDEGIEAAPAMEQDVGIEAGLDLGSDFGELESSSGETVDTSGKPQTVADLEMAPHVEAESLEESFAAPPDVPSAGEELEVGDSGGEEIDFTPPSFEAEEEIVAKEEEKVEKISAKEKAVEKKVSEKTMTNTKVKLPKEVKVEEEELEFSAEPEVETVAVSEEISDVSEVEASFEPEVEPEVVMKSAPIKESQARPTRNRKDEFEEVVQHHDDELVRLSATIRSLRDDRQQLLDKIFKLEDDKNNLQQDFISAKADLDEKKIEVTLIKKRHNDELNHIRYQLNLSEEKRIILEEKNKMLKQEFDKIAQKVRIDFNKIQNREKELENQLELLKADSEVQLRNRDHRILELKRKIDTLEFDMENIVIKETQSKSAQYELENKLEKTIQTLRNAINSLEIDEQDIKKFELLKKKTVDL
jgi:hypothetical protein